MVLATFNLSIPLLQALVANSSQNYQLMIPNLFEATKEYWRKLDRLEAAYQQGEVSLEDVDAKVAKLMADLAQERRAAFTYFLRGWRHRLTTQRETLIGLGAVALVAYAWVLTSLNA